MSSGSNSETTTTCTAIGGAPGSASSNNGKINNKKYNNGNNDNKSTLASIDKDFKGMTPEINGVLGLKSEKLTYKVHYPIFEKNLQNCILKEVKNARDVISIITLKDDPIKKLTTNITRDVSTLKEKANNLGVDVKTVKHTELKRQFLTQDRKRVQDKFEKAESNLENIYGVIKG